MTALELLDKIVSMNDSVHSPGAKTEALKLLSKIVDQNGAGCEADVELLKKAIASVNKKDKK